MTSFTPVRLHVALFVTASRSMSESSGGRESRWHCKHCGKEFELPPGAVFQFCPECRAPEQEFDFDAAVYCVNPDCKTNLFTPTQKLCHECGASQSPGRIDQATSTPNVRVAGVPSPSSSVVPTDTTQAEHREVVEKPQRSQTTTTQRMSEDSQHSTTPISESISTTSQCTTPPPTASTAINLSMCAGNKGLLNDNHSQPHQAKSDGTHDRDKKVEEGKGGMPVSKPKEATKESELAQENGQEHDYPQLKLAVNHPLQNHSADNHSIEHPSTSNKCKQAAESGEEIADGSDPLSKQQKVNSSSTQVEEALPSVSDQHQEKYSAQPRPPNSATVVASEQVCHLL